MHGGGQGFESPRLHFVNPIISRINKEDRKRSQGAARVRGFLAGHVSVLRLRAIRRAPYAFVNQSGLAVLLTVISLIVAGIVHLRPEEGTGSSYTLVEPMSAEPISEAEHSRMLDNAIGGYLLRAFFVRLRTPTTAQLFKPRKFSFISALLQLTRLIVIIVISGLLRA